jgi:hypothetical protein
LRVGSPRPIVLMLWQIEGHWRQNGSVCRTPKQSFIEAAGGLLNCDRRENRGFQHRVMAGADRIGNDSEEEIVQWTISLASIYRWTRHISAFSIARALLSVKARQRRRLRRSRLAVDKREPNARAKAMRAVNPAFIPRNHRVEQALDAAIASGDFSPFADLLTVLSRPYEDQATFAEYANPPQTGERVFRTFCGT